MELVGGVGLDEVDIFVFFACLFHQPCGSLLFCSLNLIRAFIEISSFPIDGLLENYRNIRMGMVFCKLNHSEVNDFFHSIQNIYLW